MPAVKTKSVNSAQHGSERADLFCGTINKIIDGESGLGFLAFQADRAYRC